MDGLIRCAVILASTLATTGLSVDPVHLRVKYVALIPGVRSLAQSRVRRAPKIVHGPVLTLEDAIYLALFPAANCPAPSAVRQFWIVDIGVPRSVERLVRRVTIARFVVRREQKVSWWTICSAPLMGRPTSIKTRASCQIVAI